MIYYILWLELSRVIDMIGLLISELNQSVILSSNFLINGTTTKETGSATAKAIPNDFNQIIKKFGCHPAFISAKAKDIINDIMIDTNKPNNSP
jgi:hypothetical protein